MCTVLVFVYDCSHKHLQRLVSPRCQNPELCTGDAIITHRERRYWMCDDCIEFERVGFLRKKFDGKESGVDESRENANCDRENETEWDISSVGGDTEGDDEEVLEMGELKEERGEGEGEKMVIDWYGKDEMKYNTQITDFEIAGDNGYDEDMEVEWDTKDKEAGGGEEQKNHKK